MEVNSMKKELMVLAMTLMLLVSMTAPVAAKKSGGTDGPPGWSHVNPGSGGTLPGKP